MAITACKTPLETFNFEDRKFFVISRRQSIGYAAKISESEKIEKALFWPFHEATYLVCLFSRSGVPRFL
jgi:hypothetical protein